MKTGVKTTEYAYGITSLAEADAGELLAFNRGHWSVENKNPRDVNFREDDSQFSVGFGPANNAIIGNIACAVIFHRAFDGVAQATRTARPSKGDGGRSPALTPCRCGTAAARTPPLLRFPLSLPPQWHLLRGALAGVVNSSIMG